ncbi:Uncharacterized protein APZ42_003075, partial [Daphnia magna]
RLQRQHAVEDQRIDQLMLDVQGRRDLPAGAAGHQGQRHGALALTQVAVHALDGAGDGVSAAAGQRVRGVGRELAHLAGGHAQAGRAAFQRAQHDAVARHDQAAEKAARGVERIDCDRRADHHHQRGLRRLLGRGAGQHMGAGADQGDKAVRAETTGMVIAVRDAARLRAADHPARLDVPEFQL